MFNIESINKIIELEKSIAEMLKDLTEKIKQSTQETNMPGVNQVSPNAATVKVSSLDRGILCPYYYLQSAQAEIVERNLRSAKTASEFVEKMKNMIETGKVKNGSETMRINPQTIDVLKSYLSTI